MSIKEKDMNLAIAKKLLSSGMKVEEISRITEIPEDKIGKMVNAE